MQKIKGATDELHDMPEIECSGEASAAPKVKKEDKAESAVSPEALLPGKKKKTDAERTTTAITNWAIKWPSFSKTADVPHWCASDRTGASARRNTRRRTSAGVPLAACQARVSLGIILEPTVITAVA